MSWNIHTQKHISKKQGGRLNILKHLANNENHILLHFSLKKLDPIQNKAIRLIAGAVKSILVKALHCRPKLDQLSSNKKQQSYRINPVEFISIQIHTGLAQSWTKCYILSPKKLHAGSNQYKISTQRLTTHVYNDTSKSSILTDAGAGACYLSFFLLSCKLETTNFEGEVLAIKKALLNINFERINSIKL